MNMMKPTQNIPLGFSNLPDDEMAARRIEFYRRLGYEICSGRLPAATIQQARLLSAPASDDRSSEFVLDNYEK